MKSLNQPFLKSAILKVALIFVLSYVIFLVLWVGVKGYGVKGYYGTVITTISSYAVSVVKNAEVVDIVREKDIVSVGFIPKKFGLAQVYKTSIDIPISNYTFNVPLTFAIMAAFFPFLRTRRIYLEAVLILILVHIMFVFSLEGERLTKAFVSQGYEKQSDTSQVFWEFLWGFLDNMVVRFEPFLIGAYLFFFRHRAASGNTEKGKKRKGKEKAKPLRAKGKKSKK